MLLFNLVLSGAMVAGMPVRTVERVGEEHSRGDEQYHWECKAGDGELRISG